MNHQLELKSNDVIPSDRRIVGRVSEVISKNDGRRFVGSDPKAAVIQRCKVSWSSLVRAEVRSYDALRVWAKLWGSSKPASFF